MQITVTFDSLEEFAKYMKPNEGFMPETEAETVPVAEPEQEKPKRGRPKKAEAPAAEEPKEEAPAPQPEVKEVSLTDVRAVALRLSKSGKQSELKEAFGKFGAKKLSDVPKENYPALMEELGKING